MYDKIIFIKLRSLLRAFKITKIIQSNLIYRLLNQNYEAKFEKRILSYLKRSTTVYDIGANIGYYSKKFCAAVGPNGKVYAFEPISSSAIKIKDLQKEYKNLKVIELALGEKAGNVQFSVEPNPESPNNKVKINDQSESDNILTLPMSTIDEMANKYDVPDLIKIDVEGYELNILKGAKKTLKNKKLKDLFIEIHFSILKERGLEDAPLQITNFLNEYGFKTKYTDFSHLHAFRKK